jgi:hypothetical protein
MDAKCDGPGRLARGTELAVIRRGPQGGLRSPPGEIDLWLVLCPGCTNASRGRADSQSLRHELGTILHRAIDQRLDGH